MAVTRQNKRKADDTTNGNLVQPLPKQKRLASKSRIKNVEPKKKTQSKSKQPFEQASYNGVESDEKSSARPVHDSVGQSKSGNERSYWLMKAEPESRIENGIDVKFSIDDLAARDSEGWDGVRNYRARNNMRAMKKGDLAFFYHSNCNVPGIVGIMEIVAEHSIDETAHNPKHPYYDPKSDPDDPKWSLVHVSFRSKFPVMVSLRDLQKFKGPGQELENMQVLRLSRLSVSAVTTEEWSFVLELAERKKNAEE